MQWILRRPLVAFRYGVRVIIACVSWSCFCSSSFGSSANDIRLQPPPAYVVYPNGPSFDELVKLWGTDVPQDELSWQVWLRGLELAALNSLETTSSGGGGSAMAMLPPSTGGVWSIQWGFAAGIPVRGDYDGDGYDDLAVWNSAYDYEWYIHSVISNSTIAWAVQHGMSGGIPVSGDYNGDGKYDLARINHYLTNGSNPDSYGYWAVSNAFRGSP